MPARDKERLTLDGVPVAIDGESRGDATIELRHAERLEEPNQEGHIALSLPGSSGTITIILSPDQIQSTTEFFE